MFLCACVSMNVFAVLCSRLPIVVSGYLSPFSLLLTRFPPSFLDPASFLTDEDRTTGERQTDLESEGENRVVVKERVVNWKGINLKESLGEGNAFVNDYSCFLFYLILCSWWSYVRNNELVNVYIEVMNTYMAYKNFS